MLIRLTPDNAKALKKQAKQNARSVAAEANFVIAALLKQEGKPK